MIDLQPASFDIWRQKYALPGEESPDDTFRRVARALAAVEVLDQDRWEETFYQTLKQGALPGGRILSNAGAQDQKKGTSLINCTVSRTIDDSMDGILDALKDAGKTLKAGCGIGYDFSTLRPRGAPVAGVGASTSGPLSFMDVFDSLCKTISSAGGRRGAQMGTLHIRHPDVVEFIRAKREAGRLRQFNLSVLVTDEFMRAVESGNDWDFRFPVYSDTPSSNTIPARELWDMIMRSTYEYAEPGVLFIDRINEYNTLAFCESINSTNPCGEQPLPPYGACLLGSIDVSKFVETPFSGRATRFDWSGYKTCVQNFTRMLDNVVEISNLPLPEQQEELRLKRRHGMGITGFGSACVMMGMRYGDDESKDFLDRILSDMVHKGWMIGYDLAVEKGAAPILQYDISRRQFIDSKYIQSAINEDPVLHALKKHGSRFTHHTSIAPTGTISLSLGNNCSSGIEPSFAHEYTRNIIRPGKKAKESVPVYSYEALAYRQAMGRVPLPDELFYSASDVSPRDHIDIQATAQRWVDSSISKTINVPTDFPFDDFKDLYRYAWEKGCKGCTTFRFNPDVTQGVLVKKDDLANTTYTFTLSDGSTVQARGDEMIEYNGESQTAANLHDAIKDGYYGRL